MSSRSSVPFSALPRAQGLYDPANESDSCGVAFVADLGGRASHDIVAKALTALHNLEHRGAAGAEPNSGDGAGITLASARRVPAGRRRHRTARRPASTPPAWCSCRPTTRNRPWT